MQQVCKVDDFIEMVITAIGVHVLTQQVDLFDTAFGEACDFSNDVVNRSRHLFAAGVGHHAERTVLTAAFHNGDKG